LPLPKTFTFKKTHHSQLQGERVVKVLGDVRPAQYALTPAFLLTSPGFGVVSKSLPPIFNTLNISPKV
jgi:hypothetical protein